jgi:hypothetical protein
MPPVYFLDIANGVNYDASQSPQTCPKEGRQTLDPG